MELDGKSLVQLSQLGRGNHAAEFGLSHEDDLQELLARRLQVAEEAHFLQDVARQVLRLIHDENDVVVLLATADKEILDGMNKLYLGLVVRGDVQFRARRLKELLGCQRGVDDVSGFHTVAESLHGSAAEHALAGAHFTCDKGEPLALFHGVEQACQGLFVLGARIEKARVRCRRKGKCFKSKMFQVHRANAPVGEIESCYGTTMVV